MMGRLPVCLSVCTGMYITGDVPTYRAHVEPLGRVHTT